MEEGILRLSAGGFVGFTFFRVDLKFNEKLVLQDEFRPMPGLLSDGGQELNAFGCQSCSMICFNY